MQNDSVLMHSFNKQKQTVSDIHAILRGCKPVLHGDVTSTTFLEGFFFLQAPPPQAVAIIISQNAVCHF